VGDEARDPAPGQVAEYVPEADLLTTYRRESTGASLSLRPSPAFMKRFRDVPCEELGAAGRTVLGLPDAEVFEVVTDAGSAQ
jgi:hypothetical protein